MFEIKRLKMKHHQQYIDVFVIAHNSRDGLFGDEENIVSLTPFNINYKREKNGCKNRI